MNRSLAFILILVLYIGLAGCAVSGMIEGDYMRLEGWGADSATWEYADGRKYSIKKGEPIKVPDLLPLRS